MIEMRVEKDDLLAGSMISNSNHSINDFNEALCQLKASYGVNTIVFITTRTTKEEDHDKHDEMNPYFEGSAQLKYFRIVNLSLHFSGRSQFPFFLKNKIDDFA